MLATVGDILRERGLLRPSSIPLDLGVLAASTAVVATAYILQLNRTKAGRKSRLVVTDGFDDPVQKVVRHAIDSGSVFHCHFLQAWTAIYICAMFSVCWRLRTAFIKGFGNVLEVSA